jgi:hypothetical protein
VYSSGKDHRPVATPLTFTYSAGKTDLLEKTTQGESFTAITDTLAADDPNAISRVFIHGSSDVVAKQGGTDVSDRWAVFRMKRVWVRTLSPTPTANDPIGGPTGSYVEALGSRKMYTDSKEKPAGDWVDCVGWILPTRVDYYDRSLHEFGVGVQDPKTHKVRDDFGGFYVAVIIDLSPQWHRIRMSEAVTLTSSQWKAARGLGGTSPIPPTAPFRTEAATGPQAIAWAWNSDWQSWGTYNNQLPLPEPEP